MTNSRLQVLPVLDLLGGRVVRAVGGRRELYQPLQTASPDAADPLTAAIHLRDRFGFNRFYVADLDAIEGRPCNEVALNQLVGHGFSLMLDLGLRNPSNLEQRLAAAFSVRLNDSAAGGVDTHIIASETLEQPEHLAEMVARCSGNSGGTSRGLAFSVDLRGGKFVSPVSKWRDRPAINIISDAWKAGVKRFILMELTAVGTGAGLATLELLKAVMARYPAEVFVGGGVAGPADLIAAKNAGAAGVLVSSALYNGGIEPEIVAGWNASPLEL